MADLCKLLKVRQIRTSVYHPQTDGLVERFNKTLKQMLRRVVKEKQLYHINLLKRWVGTGPQLSALATTSPVVVDMDPNLSAAQKTELQHLVGQFLDVFSPLPGRTTVIQHKVRTPPGVIVRQRPYRVPEARRHAIETEWPLAVPGPSLRPALGPRHIPEAHGCPAEAPYGLRHGLPRRHGHPFRDLGGAFGAAPEGAAGPPSGGAHRQPPEMSPGSLRSQVPGLLRGTRPHPPPGKEGDSYPLGTAAHYQDPASSLTDLTRKGQPEKVAWSPEAEEAFQQVKSALTTEPVLRAPDFNCSFLVQTDASDTGLGAVLSQVQDGEEHPVIFISRKLTPTEQRYAAVEKEALAIKWAVLELRYYLLGRRFTLLTDHAPLQWMARAKDTNPRVTRWFLALQDFHFTIQHRAGTANANADGLSKIGAAFAGLSGSTPHPPHISPLSRRRRSTLRGGECDMRPERSSASPWQHSGITGTSSSRAERPHLQLVKRRLLRQRRKAVW
ncbi:uncharacterized protein LOC127934429 [Carassius gibelio]|uniref:uncharacterized protein LOC127934429 n=1 Tax=Carassius gibelio TaxID=101364 RepID=UPI00227758E3|nr:uncharacterized protein LOC127934429 [Carassius gibelio]